VLLAENLFFNEEEGFGAEKGFSPRLCLIGSEFVEDGGKVKFKRGQG